MKKDAYYLPYAGRDIKILDRHAENTIAEDYLTFLCQIKSVCQVIGFTFICIIKSVRVYFCRGSLRGSSIKNVAAVKLCLYVISNSLCLCKS